MGNMEDLARSAPQQNCLRWVGRKTNDLSGVEIDQSNTRENTREDKNIQ